MQSDSDGRYRLDVGEGDQVVVIDSQTGQVIFAGSALEVRQIAVMINRYLLYGETSGNDELAPWLSTGDALALSQQHGGPGKDAIRHAARNGRFRAEKDASSRWRYERASFMRWLLDDTAHQPGRKD